MFRFRQFFIRQDRCAMKVGTDGVLLGAWAAGGSRILDIGTGTGLISLMMAQRFEESAVVGIDIDYESCLQARENVMASPFNNRISILHCALQDYVIKEGWGAVGTDKAMRFCEENSLCHETKFDAIVANPPFFDKSLKNPDIRKAKARHTDTLPSDDLFTGVSELLSEDGAFNVIIPVENVEDFTVKACFSGLYMSRKCSIRTTPFKPPKRCLMEFRWKLKRPMEIIDVCLQDSDGKRSEWYDSLTRDFYIK